MQRVDLMKADIEGAELALLVGARETLRRRKPTLLCGIYGTVLEPQDARAARMLEVLDDFGYRLLSFDDNTDLPSPLGTASSRCHIMSWRSQLEMAQLKRLGPQIN